MRWRMQGGALTRRSSASSGTEKQSAASGKLAARSKETGKAGSEIDLVQRVAVEEQLRLGAVGIAHEDADQGAPGLDRSGLDAALLKARKDIGFGIEGLAFMLVDGDGSGHGESGARDGNNGEQGNKRGL